jgi:hypothetical protein
MIELALVAALVAVVGGVLAITARDNRIVAGGLLLAMVAAPLAASPEPAYLTIAFRVIGALLAAYLLWSAARASSTTSEGSGFGIAAEVAVAAALFAVGWFVAPVKPLAGPVAAQAAGVSLAALALVPLTSRDVMRVGAAAAVMVLGISMLLAAWIGPISPLAHLVLMVMMVGIVGATSLLISGSEDGESAADELSLEASEPDTTSEETLAASEAALSAGDTKIAPLPDLPAPEPRPSRRSGAPKPVRGATPADSAQTGAALTPPAGTNAQSEVARPAPGASPEPVPTLRSSAARSPRAIRQSAMVKPLQPPTADTLADTPTPDPEPEAPSTVRRMRPREPRR